MHSEDRERMLRFISRKVAGSATLDGLVLCKCRNFPYEDVMPLRDVLARVVNFDKSDTLCDIEEV